MASILLVQQLKGFQDHLGAFQDAHTQNRYAPSFQLGDAADDFVPTDTLLAMGALLGQLDQKQIAITGRFDEFAREDNNVRFRRLFAPSPGNAKD